MVLIFNDIHLNFKLLIFILLTFTKSFNTSIIALHTTGTITKILCLDILKRYIELVFESPVAKTRNVTVSLSLTGKLLNETFGRS